MTAGRVVAISVAAVVERIGERGAYRTAIGKSPVAGPVLLDRLGFAGDAQADRRVHGGPTMAAYAYAREDYAWWEAQLDRPLPPGTFGENLLLESVDVSKALLGERWRIGEAEVTVTLPRIPCATLARAMTDPAFVKTFAAALRPGAYFAVDRPGFVAANDPVVSITRPAHDVTVAEAARIRQFAPHEFAALVDREELGTPFRDWAREGMAAARARGSVATE